MIRQARFYLVLPCVLLVSGTMVLISVLAQPGNGVDLPEFDAASVKPNLQGSASRTAVGGGRLKFTAGRVVSATIGSQGPGGPSSGVTVRRLILEAWHIRSSYQLEGGPSWMDSDRFDIEGKAAAPVTEDQLRLMLRRLLIERFRLAIHKTKMDLPVYALIPGRTGIKFPEWETGKPAPTQPKEKSAPTGGAMTIHDDMHGFAGELSQLPDIDRPVIDKTGLTGAYLITLQWDADEDMKSVVERSSGLKLQPQKGEIEVFVVDHVERPSQN